MANFVAVLDPDGTRRTSFIRRIASQLTPVDDLIVTRLDAGDLAVAWAAASGAPVSQWTGEDELAVIWGHAYRGSTGPPIDASSLAGWRWAAEDAASPVWDGYHAVLRFRQGAGFLLGSDLLGLFPIYFASRDGVLIAGSSPRPIRSHPLFPAELDTDGLAGLLLSGCAIGGRTLLRGVQRLDSGHSLVWMPGDGVRQIRRYEMPLPEARSAPFEEQVARLDLALKAAVRRQATPGEAHGLLLSGGLDSRMMAGYLADHASDIEALTFGMPGDHESRCATAVARALRLRHARAEIAESDYSAGALLQARWEQLATGFSTVHMWAALPLLKTLPPRLISGYFADAVLSRGSLIEPDMPFDAFFGLFNRRGIGLRLLKRLLRSAELRDQVDATVERIRARFEASATVPAQRIWRFHIFNTERVGVGTVPWRMTFASWPVLPILDRGVLDVVGSLPDLTLSRRRAQSHLVRTRFPRLARLPLDRNTASTLPLLPTQVDRLASRISTAADTLRRRCLGQPDRRRFHRIFDFSGPGWRSIRARAEPFRECLADLFDMDALKVFLPQPDETVRLDHTIRDSHGRKLIVGLMLWRAEDAL